MNDPSDPVLDQCDIEVDEQTESVLRELQVGQKLSRMTRQNRLDSFRLDDDETFYDHINPKAGLDACVSIDNRHGDLAFNR
jgi:hypothetical protein